MTFEKRIRGAIDGWYRRTFDLADGGVTLNPRRRSPELYPTGPNDAPLEGTEPGFRPVCR